MRLIDADALLEVLGDPHMMVMLSKTKAEETGEWGMLLRRMDVLRRVLSAPTIDAAPVVHARWVSIPIPSRYGGCVVECSKCYNRGNRNFSFCPSCGAKMDGGAEA